MERLRQLVPAVALRARPVAVALYASVAALGVCAIAAAIAPQADATGWGINLDGAVSGNPPAFTYESNPYFTQLLGGPSCTNARAICYARLLVPWDAVNDGRGSFAAGRCQASPSGPGTPADVYRRKLSAAARAVGIGHVLVALTVAGSPTDDIWPTDSEYECGLRGLQAAAPGVTDWEVFNEPDSIYYPDSTATGGPDCNRRNGVWVPGACLFADSRVNPASGNGHGGSAQGAAHWYLDAKRVDSNPHHTLLAGGVNYSSSRCTPTTCYYLTGYMRALSRIDRRPPDAIALHPYIDVIYGALNGGDPVPPAASGLPSAYGAINAIDRVWHSRPPIWFTESGVWLQDAGREAVTAHCADGKPQDAGSWAACVNGNPNAQALAAEAYLRLARASRQVKRVYYYDFDGQNAGWDSGLVNLSQPLLGPQGYGTPRTTWCVLHAFAMGAAPHVAAAQALQPGSTCDDVQGGNLQYVPFVDQAYLSDPLPVAAPPPPPPPAPPTPPPPSPGQVASQVMLAVAEHLRALIGFL